MNNNIQLSKAIYIATKIHRDQYDKGGKPYILHPLHIMNQLMFDVELATIGVLHDVIEDSKGRVDFVTLTLAGFSRRILEGLDLLTHKEGDDYLGVYIKNICSNYDAIRVKRKDLEHNSDITRLKGIRPKDIERIEKYHKAFLILGEAKRKFHVKEINGKILRRINI